MILDRPSGGRLVSVASPPQDPTEDEKKVELHFFARDALNTRFDEPATEQDKERRTRNLAGPSTQNPPQFHAGRREPKSTVSDLRSFQKSLIRSHQVSFSFLSSTTVLKDPNAIVFIFFNIRSWGLMTQNQ